MSVCELCEKRRARRYCPGVRGDICPRCCGEEREISIDCPLECEFLQEARRHEKPPEVDPDEIPNKDIEVTKQFLHRNEHLVNHIGRALVTAALTTPGVVDSDVREALQAMIRTYLTLESGLIYETHTNNPYAGAIQQRLGTAISETSCGPTSPEISLRRPVPSWFPEPRPSGGAWGTDSPRQA